MFFLHVKRGYIICHGCKHPPITSSFHTLRPAFDLHSLGRFRASDCFRRTSRSPGGTVSASASVRLGPFLLPAVGCCKSVGRMLSIDSLPMCWPSCLASCFTRGLPHLCVPRPRPRCLPQRILCLLLSHPIQTLALRAPIVLTARPPTMHLRHHLVSPAPCPLVGLCYSSRHLKPPSLKPHVLSVLEASCGVSCRLRFCATTAPLSRACSPHRPGPITLTYALSCPPPPSG